MANSRTVAKRSSPTNNERMQNAIRSIRVLLGVSQAELADVLGCTQSNVSFYEKGQTFPPESAKKLIDFSAGKGMRLTFDHIYGAEPLPKLSARQRDASLKANEAA